MKREQFLYFSVTYINLAACDNAEEFYLWLLLFLNGLIYGLLDCYAPAICFNEMQDIQIWDPSSNLKSAQSYEYSLKLL